ncbi:MAG: hypothetical protein OXM57_01865 [bacterium]|nr:hypothetical protein [bacterium]MDE0351429.1 hypothetical protein [bacterium]
MSEAPAAPFETEPGWHAVLAVRRRLGGRWSLGLVGALLILHGGGLLFGWLPTSTLLGLIYPNEDDLPGLETRDMGWAAMFLIVGVLLVVWTSVRLVSRRPVLRADRDGLGLAVRGPFRRTVTVPWSEVDSVSATTVSDGYGDVPALLIRLADPSRIGSNPWGARWMEPSTLSVNAPDWKRHPQSVVDRLREVGAIGTRPPPEEVGPDPSPPDVTGDPVADVPSDDGDA